MKLTTKLVIMSEYLLFTLLFVMFSLGGVAFAEDAKVGESCGGSDERPCVEGLFCEYPKGTCGESSVSGTCSEVPEMCIEMWAPVCGCDGKTYGNSCKAGGAQVSVKKDGKCADGEK